MAEDANPWPDLVEAASATIRKSDRGDTSAAQEALRAAAVGLRDVLAGGTPDPERLAYLEFLLRGLEQIDRNVDPRKALGLWGSKRIPEDRDLMLLLRVGVELDKLKAQSAEIESPVARAIQIVANKTGHGDSTVEKAWKTHGGEDGWDEAAKQL
jgi:hypothetical protein